MSRISIIVLLLFLGSTSCGTEQKKQSTERTDQKDTPIVNGGLDQNSTDGVHTAENENTAVVESDHSNYLTHSIPSFNVDDYPVTNAMFNSAKYLEEPILSFNGLWFSSGNQTLAIALYTDNYRYATFHFNDDLVPADLIEEMVLHKPLPGNEIANLGLKRELFPGIFPTLNEVDTSFFRSNKGFRLGDNRSKAIDVYGQPNSVKTDKEIEILYWEFIGDSAYDGKQNRKGRPLAKNSFGHQIRMYFKNERLIGMCLHNDIP